MGRACSVGRSAGIRGQVMPGVVRVLALLAVLLAPLPADPLWIAGVYDGADGNDLTTSVEAGELCVGRTPSGCPLAGTTVRWCEPADDPRSTDPGRSRPGSTRTRSSPSSSPSGTSGAPR